MGILNGFDVLSEESYNKYRHTPTGMWIMLDFWIGDFEKYLYFN